MPLVWGFWIEPASLVVRETRVAASPWPPACRGLRVAVLADLHVGSPHSGMPKLREIVNATNAAAPDVVLLAGDYVIHGVLGGEFESPESIAQELARLDASSGVFAVLGNHDHWLDAGRTRRALEAAGIRVLDNESDRLTHDACRFWLAGIGDFGEGVHDVAAALASIPDPAPILAFTHNPDVFPILPDRISLTIAGHTHGGQVALPLLGRPIVPSLYGERFAIGSIVEADRSLFVSPGLGTSILPVRFRVPPEISLLTIADTVIESSTTEAGREPAPTGLEPRS